MKILFLDTETTGLPDYRRKYGTYKDLVKFSGCRLLMLSYSLYEIPKFESKDYEENLRKCNMLLKKTYIIKCIKVAATEIHGITQEDSDKGHCVNDVLSELINDITREKVELIVGHNIAFDDDVINSELFRLGRECLLYSSIKRYCTMNVARDLYGRLIKLGNLYKILFEREFDGVAHKADEDVRCCYLCYIRLITL